MFPAIDLAKKWCEKHQRWQRICDIPDSDAMSLKWDEIPKRDREYWERLYPHSSEDMWREFSSVHVTRHRRGYIADDGQFYGYILDVPRMMNTMMVFETGGKPGVYYRGGMHEESSKAKVSAATTESKESQ